MRDFVIKIKEKGASFWVYLPVIGYRNKSRFYTRVRLGNAKTKHLYNLVTVSSKNPSGDWNEIIPRADWYPLVECEPNEATLIRTKNPIQGHNYTECVHLGGGNYMRQGKVKLWDNTITGLNNIKHLDDLNATVFRLGSAAKGVTYFKQISKEVLWEMN